jgi:hypothetical protein
LTENTDEEVTCLRICRIAEIRGEIAATCVGAGAARFRMADGAIENIDLFHHWRRTDIKDTDLPLHRRSRPVKERESRVRHVCNADVRQADDSQDQFPGIIHRAGDPVQKRRAR